uniref:Putative ribonuclease ZC3H12D n=1 Tax=Sipha flava TaxID=143950 RepID=A0A2S2Q0B9_9HEMI
MGRVLRKKTKNIGSVPTQVLNSSKKTRKSKTNITLAKTKKLTKHVQINNELNENVNSSIEVIETEDNSFPLNDKLKNMNTVDSKAKMAINTSIDVIDITNSTIYDSNYENSKKINLNLENDGIIDLTDTTIISNNVNEHVNSLQSKCMLSINDDDDDIQIIEHNPIEIIISDDSDDDENIIHLTSVKKPIGLKSIEKHLSIPNSSKGIMKKKYNSPLRNRKHLKGKSSDNHLPINLGAFIIDKQRISNYSKKCDSYQFKSTVNVPSMPQLQKPSPDTTFTVARQLRPIVIDGLNIGHAYGSGIFSVKGIEICIQFFANRGHKDILAFLPQHRQGPPGSESNIILNKLVKKGHICYTPSRKVENLRMTCYDDRIILNHAHQCGGVVVSNDNYRDLYEESEAFKEIIGNRQVMVTFARGQIIVPDDQYNRKSDIRSLSDILCFPA